MSQQPYHIYLDLDVLNNSVASGAKPQQLVFEETRNTPFLDGDASEYFSSIIRFSIQTGSSLPVFIPRMDTSQTADPNKTVYKISLSYKGQTITQNITYTPAIPQTAQAGLLASTNTRSYATSEYYYIKNYQDFIVMINNTLENCYFALALGAVALKATYPPFLELDPQSLKCVLNADVLFYDDSLTFPVTIYFNSRLFELFKFSKCISKL